MATSATMETVDCDVVIVGAGPVGMTAAALLAVRGINVVVLEKLQQPSSEPKAISLDDESLRTYQSAGLADDVLSIVVPGTGTLYYDAQDQPLFHARGSEPFRLGHPFKNPFAQPDLERVLRDVLVRADNVTLRSGATVERVVTDDAGVIVTAALAAERGALQIRAPFVIGADGGRSTVREQLRIHMVGRTHPERWIVIDTLEDWHQERYGMHHGNPDRPHVIVPGLDGRCRYEFLLHPDEGEPGDAPSLELMRRLIAPYRNCLAPDQIERAIIYTFHGLQAVRWSAGGAFLAGDAAHMMPPFAGQGLNSGVRDVANLTWKLADVLQGRLTPGALGTYETERRPHVTATIRLSERLGQVVMTTSAQRAERRDRIIRSRLATPEGRAYLEGMRYRPQIRVTEGLIVPPLADSHGRADLAASFVGTSIAQPRAFDTAVHRVRMLDDITGNGWAVIGVDVSADAWAEAQTVAQLARAPMFEIPLGDRLPKTREDVTVLLDLDGDLQREFAPHSGTFLLVRPDRLIAARWPPTQTSQVISAISGWFVVDNRKEQDDYRHAAVSGHS